MPCFVGFEIDPNNPEDIDLLFRIIQIKMPDAPYHGDFSSDYPDNDIEFGTLLLKLRETGDPRFARVLQENAALAEYLADLRTIDSGCDA
jgi:hypothetical protein